MTSKRNNACWGIALIIIGLCLLFFPKAQVGKSLEKKARKAPDEFAESFKVFSDIQPSQLEEKLNQLSAQGYTIDRDRDIKIVGSSFTLIFTGDELPAEPEEGAGK